MTEQTLLATHTPPVRQRRRWHWVAAAVVIVLAAGVTGALALRGGGGTFTLHGTIAVVDQGSLLNRDSAGSACAAPAGYDDVTAGAQAVVKTSNGNTVAYGTPGAGTWVWDGSADSCTFPFTVAGIPTGGGPYSVEVGHRGAVDFTQADTEKGTFGLTLGS
jgi:hypothetical protein